MVIDVLLKIATLAGLFILSLIWVYMAIRMGVRAILRSYQEYVSAQTTGQFSEHLNKQKKKGN